MDLFVQFLVLAFTAVVWWIARRDLNARAAETNLSRSAEWRTLRSTIEDLITLLEQRAEAAEQRLAAAERRVAALVEEARRLPDPMPLPALAEDEKYAPVYALAASGMTDTTEIARRTGLGRGEVQLLLDLRARHAR